MAPALSGELQTAVKNLTKALNSQQTQLRASWVALCRKYVEIQARLEQREARRRHRPDLVTDSDGADDYDNDEDEDNEQNDRDEQSDDEQDDDADADDLRDKQQPFAIWAWQNIDHNLLIHSISAEMPNLVDISSKVTFNSLQKLFDVLPPTPASAVSGASTSAQRHGRN